MDNKRHLEYFYFIEHCNKQLQNIRYYIVTHGGNIYHACFGKKEFQTYTLSAVTFRISMTSHFPEVIAVTLPCIIESQQNVCGNMSQEHIHDEIIQCAYVILIQEREVFQA